MTGAKCRANNIKVLFMSYQPSSPVALAKRLWTAVTSQRNFFKPQKIMNENYGGALTRLTRIIFMLTFADFDHYETHETVRDLLFRSKSFRNHFEGFFQAIGPRVFNFLAYPYGLLRITNIIFAAITTPLHGWTMAAKKKYKNVLPAYPLQKCLCGLGFIAVGFFLCLFSLPRIACGIGMFVTHYITRVGDILFKPIHALALHSPRSFWLTTMASFIYTCMIFHDPSHAPAFSDMITGIKDADFWVKLVLGTSLFNTSVSLSAVVVSSVLSVVATCVPKSIHESASVLERTLIRPLLTSLNFLVPPVPDHEQLAHASSKAKPSHDQKAGSSSSSIIRATQAAHQTTSRAPDTLATVSILPTLATPTMGGRLSLPPISIPHTTDATTITHQASKPPPSPRDFNLWKTNRDGLDAYQARHHFFREIHASESGDHLDRVPFTRQQTVGHDQLVSAASQRDEDGHRLQPNAQTVVSIALPGTVPSSP